MTKTAKNRFKFGRNWTEFSRRALTPEKSAESFAALHSWLGVELRDKKFLDVGFGQGLAVIAGVQAGARVTGIDLDGECLNALRQTASVNAVSERPTKLLIGSILNESIVEGLLKESGGFDVVHSWGVLHHTGDLETAFSNCCRLVRQQGILAISIYNRHWSSPLWKLIKQLYNHLPRIGQVVLVYLLYPVIYFAKLAVTRVNPLAKQRGMDFFTMWSIGWEDIHTSIVP